MADREEDEFDRFQREDREKVDRAPADFGTRFGASGLTAVPTEDEFTRFQSTPPPEPALPPSTGFWSDLQAGRYPMIYKPGAFSGPPGGHVLSAHTADIAFPEGMREAPGVTLGGAAAGLTAPLWITPAGRAAALGRHLGWRYVLRPGLAVAGAGLGYKLMEDFLPESWQPHFMHYLSEIGH